MPWWTFSIRTFVRPQQALPFRMIEREAVRPADERPAAAREEHPQVGVDLGDRADGAASAGAEALLVDHDAGGDVPDGIYPGGRVSWDSRRRAYVLNVSTSWRYASAQIVSNTSDDLPLPLTSLNATSRG
ncbi:MAG: hypothetical protein OXG72_03500 [Acidobacteria bacterium]|nr:hypothetical protein [Acidobacteriota bacterium]